MLITFVNRADRLREAATRLRGVKILPLAYETLLKAIELRIKYHLAHFDPLLQ